MGGRAASPDPKGVSRARSSSPGSANAVASALPHQSLEHAMQTKLTIGELAETNFWEGVPCFVVLKGMYLLIEGEGHDGMR